MRSKASLIVGLPVLIVGLLGLLGAPLAVLGRSSVQPGHRTWPGPPGTRWAGTELRGMDVWSGWGGNAGVSDNLLELRCVTRPLLKKRLSYWPGPEWRGWAEWKADRVTYQPGWKSANPRIEPVSISAPWWLRWCPS